MTQGRLRFAVRRAIYRAFVLFLCVAFSTGILQWIIPSRSQSTFSGIQNLLPRVIYGMLMFAGAFHLALYVIGFWRRRAGWSRDLQVWDQVPKPPVSRTAIVMPIYNEDTKRVYLGVRQVSQSLTASRLDGSCDFFLLSDSTDADICRREEEICCMLWAEFGRISLVRRHDRVGFKAGNIANFLEKHGNRYSLMLVLDADSVMDGETIRRMILRMEASPKLAILQSTIIPIRAVTPFARTMQYSLGRTMPLYARGLYWFFGKYSVYWGHNALVRVAPFMEHARLPTLPGKPPLGGTVLSQDIVEAALLGRAGWDIEWDIDNGGSFDELPPNILAYGTRDRRWCQGNVQHFPFIFWPGMKFGHRLYFANGIFAYLAGPLLLVLMFLDFIGSMFSPMPDAGFGFNVRTLVVVFGMAALPRFLGLLRSSEMHRRNLKFKNPGDSVPTNGVSSHWAGWKFEVPSTLLELALSILTAPLLFYLHARFVLEILSGRSIAWKNQSRNPEEALSWSDAGRLFWPATLLGAIWLGAALLWAPSSVIALMPILLAWVGSIPLAVVTSNLALGEFLLNAGLFPNAFGTDERSELGELATSSARPCARVRGALESVAPNDEQFVARNERRT